MANRPQHKGTCYLCGQQTTKAYMGRHILSAHPASEGNQNCFLLKVEDEYKNYWLFLDLPLTSSLATLDGFLRRIWLECCGHMSAFMPPRTFDEISMSTKIGKFEPGTVLEYQYDFGSTTTLYITFVQTVTRKKQQAAVRVLARNDPYEFACEECGKKATQINVEEWPPVMLCDECSEDLQEEGYVLPVVNSPRMGVCAYCGEYDVYAPPYRRKKS